MSSTDDLATSVSEELFWNPVVDDASIAVFADDGRITLRGTVGSLREKRAAEKAAQRVFGVVSVESQLQVALMEDEQRADAELRGDVLQALVLDGLVPKTVDAQVEDGLVTLTGSAQWQYQRDEAERVASSIVGARDVSDEIQLEHPRANAGDAIASMTSESNQRSQSAGKVKQLGRIADTGRSPWTRLILLGENWVVCAIVVLLLLAVALIAYRLAT